MERSAAPALTSVPVEPPAPSNMLNDYEWLLSWLQAQKTFCELK